jgi:hypothetical protein
MVAFHDLKAGAIGETPALVRSLLVALKGSFELFRRLGADHHVAITAKRLDRAGNSLPQPGTTVTEAIEKFNEYHLACYDPRRRKALRDIDRLGMKLISRIQERDPITRVGEDLRHLPVFLLP